MFAHREEESGCSPCLIVAHGDPAYVALLRRSFRQRGWHVHRGGGLYPASPATDQSSQPVNHPGIGGGADSTDGCDKYPTGPD